MSDAQSLAKIYQMIRGIPIAMLTTQDAEGRLRSRPMVTQNQEADGFLWFFNAANSPKSDEIREHAQVNLTYTAPERFRFVSVSGKAELTKDRAKMAEFWIPSYETWFPKGLEDPELSLLKIRIEHAEYWDVASGQMRTLGDHQKLDLRSIA